MTSDSKMGVAWVYCKSHVGPHEAGWCTVSANNKIPLTATTRGEAMAEVRAMGLRIYGYCDVCGKWVCNERWYRAGRNACPEHDLKPVAKGRARD